MKQFVEYMTERAKAVFVNRMELINSIGDIIQKNFPATVTKEKEKSYKYGTNDVVVDAPCYYSCLGLIKKEYKLSKDVFNPDDNQKKFHAQDVGFVDKDESARKDFYNRVNKDVCIPFGKSLVGKLNTELSKKFPYKVNVTMTMPDKNYIYGSVYVYIFANKEKIAYIQIFPTGCRLGNGKEMWTIKDDGDAFLVNPRIEIELCEYIEG